MALATPGTAIGAVTQLLQDHLHAARLRRQRRQARRGGGEQRNAKLNLFLYETGFDGHLRNHSLRDGEQPPLWLVLKYLLTAFDDDENSDTPTRTSCSAQGISRCTS